MKQNELKACIYSREKNEKVVLIVLNCWQMKRVLNTLKRKKRKFPIQRKIDIDTKKNSFKLVSSLALPSLYFLTVNSLGQDLSQIILVVSI